MDNKELQKLYDEQYPKFEKDESYFKDYEGWEVNDNYLLVRFFRVEKKSSLILQDTVTGKQGGAITIPTDTAKVIKSGDPKIKPGDIVKFPFTEVAAPIRNPEMEAYIQNATKGANAVQPLDTREFIPAIEYNNRRNLVCQPGKIVPQAEDNYTFVFGSSLTQLHKPL